MTNCTAPWHGLRPFSQRAKQARASRKQHTINRPSTPGSRASIPDSSPYPRTPPPGTRGTLRKLWRGQAVATAGHGTDTALHHDPGVDGRDPGARIRIISARQIGSSSRATSRRAAGSCRGAPQRSGGRGRPARPNHGTWSPARRQTPGCPAGTDPRGTPHTGSAARSPRCASAAAVPQERIGLLDRLQRPVRAEPATEYPLLTQPGQRLHRPIFPLPGVVPGCGRITAGTGPVSRRIVTSAGC